MQNILAVLATILLLILSGHYLRLHLARQRLIKGNNLTFAPRVDSAYIETDFKTAYNTARSNDQSVNFLQNILFPQPGRTAAVQADSQMWLMTSNVENIKSMLATNADAMYVEPLRKGMLQGWVGDGMFGSDGERWKVSRNLFKPMFSRAPVSELRQWEKRTQQFFANLPEQGTTVDLQPLFIRLYFDASIETMFGQSANSQRPELATFDIETFEANFEAVMTGSYLKMVEAASDAVDKDWQDKCDYIHAIFDQYIERALKERRTGKKSSNASMLHGLIDFSDNKQFLRDQLVNVFLGAKDTAGIGISLIMFFLARNPKVYERLRNEVMAIGDRPLTFELLKSMKYLQSVMAECLRILSPVNIILRMAKEDTMLPRGGGPDGQQPIFIAKNTRIEANIAVLQRDPQLWGSDAEAFNPDRFAGLATKWEYIPFGGGARMCPAQQMMLTQYAYLLVKFARRFSRIENRDPVEEFVAEIIFSQQSKNGVKVALYE